MNEVVEVYLDHQGSTHLVGHLRYLSRSLRQSSLFEYCDS